ncbi:MAG TPA: hypothetical protein PK230_08635, partial [Chitinophagales bacterium]|nr:hypothetical protein [Chitinophagales bacterium]
MRKQRAKKRPLSPDPRFQDPLVTRFVNMLMWDGKKSIAFTSFYAALDKVSDSTKEDGYEIWKKALNNVLSAFTSAADFSLARYHQDVSTNRSCQTANWFECQGNCCS